MYNKLCEKVEHMLEDYDRRAEQIEKSDLEALNHLTKIKKNLAEIEMLERSDYSYGGDYSHAGEWRANMHGNYGDSSRRRGRGADGRYVSRGSYGGDDIASKIDEMMRDARSEETKSVLRQLKRELDD